MTGRTCSPCPPARAGQPLPGGEAARLLAAVAVLDAAGRGLRRAARRPGHAGLPPAGRDGRPSLEDGLLSAWLGPFGWLLLAEPVDAGTLEELTSEAALRPAGGAALRQPPRQARRAPRRRPARGAAAGRLHRPVAGAPARRGRHPGAGRAGRRAAARLHGPGGPAVRAAARPARRHALAGHDRDAAVPPGGRCWTSPTLQWAAADGRQRAAAMSPVPGRARASPGVGGGAVAGAAAGRPVLRLHRAGRRAGPGARAGGARPADGAAPAVRPDPRDRARAGAAGAGGGAAGAGAGLEPGPVR